MPTTMLDGETYTEALHRRYTDEAKAEERMKTSELTGAALDWAVAKCEGVGVLVCLPNDYPHILRRKSNIGINFNPSTDWSQCGPIIEREELCFMPILEDDDSTSWAADKRIYDLFDQNFTGQTPLIAAMRCYVATKLGDEVDVPEELKLHTSAELGKAMP